MYKLYITARDKKTDVTPVLLDDIVYKTGALGSSGTLTFTVSKSLVTSGNISFHEGDKVNFFVQDTEVFCGYVFSKERAWENHIKVVCYDQIRYLKSHDSQIFVNSKASDIIKKLAAIYGITVGNIADTGYVAPYMIFENKTLMDMILTMLKLTEDNTGKRFILYDNCGKLTLSNSEDMKVSILLSSNGAILDYKYKTDIDGDTYNKVKLVRTERKTNEQVSVVSEDKDMQKRWGYLQYFEKVSYDTTTPMMNEMAKMVLNEKNRVRKQLSINALGDLRIRGGVSVYVEIMGELDADISGFFMVCECEHRFKNGVHLMELQLEL